MPNTERQSAVLDILQNLGGLNGLKRLFWEELNYERENRPLSVRRWPEPARMPLAEDPVLFASGGEDGAFHVVYCRLESDKLLRGHQRPIVNCLTREHPYGLFVFSNKDRTDWHFLNVKYDEEVEKRRLFRRIAVRPGEGLRTATERLQMLDLAAIRADLSGLSPLEIQQRHDDAFDVEKVSKDFYREIANWYFWALKHVKFPKNAPKEQDGRDHSSVIRLITRLIFCWFMREKGLIPDVLFNEARLAAMLEGFAPRNTGNKDSVFYRAILQNLFFATLNTEAEGRGWRRADQNFMAHSLYRHKECFRDPSLALDWFKDIPFLNGGLFECLDKDLGKEATPRYVRIDGFSDREDSRPTVPDFLFFGREENVDLSEDYGDKKFRSVPVRGLITTLNQYKFTIEENTPLDQEVALDPELCGKVFENLLAAYNPETGTTARKATGSFYTPREIVDYMVDESVVAYLKGKLTTEDTEGTENRLRALLAYDAETPEFNEAETETLIEAIDNLKALDPAVGSGAFPMGILHKLVHVLGRLDPDNERWKAKQIAKLDDAVMREDAERVFRENYDDYGRKLYLIENCIYGVDIQPIAVQIAKMRFFISLIVDQRVNPKAPNRGVRALPNLETKFVAANTLIGIDRPRQKMFRNSEIDRKEAELRKVREKHFTARTLKSKAKCREDDKRLRGEISELLKEDGWNDTIAKQLAAWDPYDQNAHADFFDREWMFGLTEGFDIVTGNPPYVQIQKLCETVKKRLQSQGYHSFAKTADLYCLFYERGLALSRSEGTLAYISSNKFFRAGYGKALRQFLNEQKAVRIIVDFGELPVFEAGTDPCILLVSNCSPSGDAIRAAVIKEASGIQNVRSTVECIGFHIEPASLRPEGWAIEGGSGAALLDKIRTAGQPLGEYVKRRFYRGVLTGLNDAFVIDRRTRDRLIAEDPRSAKLIKPWLRGKDIRRWYADYQDLYVINILSGANHRWPWTGQSLERAQACFRDTHPAIYRHLLQYRDKLLARDDQGQYYWELRSCAYHAEFEKPKIVYNETSKQLHAFFDDQSLCINKTGFIIVCETAKYLLGIMNSSMMDYFYRSEFPSWGDPWKGGRVQFRGDRMAKIGIPVATAQQRAGIESLVNRIVAAKKADPTADTSLWEREIDERVYKLYGLTAEEIKIVEGAVQ